MSNQNRNDTTGEMKQDDVQALDLMVREGVDAWLEGEYTHVAEELKLIDSHLEAFQVRRAEALAKLPEDLRALLSPGRVGATAEAYRKAFGYAIKAARG